MRASRRLRGCVYGAAVGDALGVPFEFMRRGTFGCVGMVGHGTHDQQAGTWSDDTSMILAELDCLADTGGYGDCYEYWTRWLDGGAYTPDGVTFDFGGTTARAITERRGQAGEWDKGNGSVMRTAPLALLDELDMSGIVAMGAMTHDTWECDCACEGVARMVREAAEGTRPKDFGPPDNPGSAYCHDTEMLARHCVATSGSYREAVLKAVNFGGDTDTTACVTGAIAATLWGMDVIPMEWMEALRGKDLIEGVLAKFGV